MSNNLATLPAQGRALSVGILSPTNLDEALKVADMLSKSTIVPKDYIGQPGNVLVAIQWGMELGLAPLQAMQNIAVINGRPSVWGDALLAIVRASPCFEGISETIEGEGDAMTAVCVVKRRGSAEVTRTFSMSDAKKAGLAGKQGPWQQYPKRMLQMRARGYALRDEFTDVLKGMAIAEEEQDKERDVTAEGETIGTERASRTEAIKSKLLGNTPAGEVLPTVTLASVSASFAKAGDLDALNAAAAAAKGLPAEDQKALRAAYKARKHEIEDAQAQQPQSGPDADDQALQELEARGKAATDLIGSVPDAGDRRITHTIGG